MKLLLSLLLLPTIVLAQETDFNYTGSNKDSINAYIERVKSKRPYCDSIKSWYYRWEMNSPDGSYRSWGENTLCQWVKPTQQEIKKIAISIQDKKWYYKYGKYLKVYYYETPGSDWCQCQDRKKAF